MSVRKANRPTSTCWCEGRPSFDPDYEFIDETGFECAKCSANVYYVETVES